MESKAVFQAKTQAKILLLNCHPDLQVHEVQGLRGQEGAHEEAQRGVEVGQGARQGGGQGRQDGGLHQGAAPQDRRGGGHSLMHSLI